MSDYPDIFVNFELDSSELDSLGGCSPREEEFGNLQEAPTFASRIDKIPRSEWDTLMGNAVNKALVKKIKNQRSEPSCTSNATAQLFEIIWNRTFGLDRWVEFSPISLYKRVGSPRSGSSCSSNIREIKNVGILPVDNPGNREMLRDAGLDPSHVMPPTGYSTPFPSGWQNTAQHFRLDEVFDIGNMDEFFTALLKGMPVLYGRSGHAICGVELERHSGQYASEYANSWGNWGRDGYGLDTESYLRSRLGNYGAFAGRSVVTPEFMLAG